MNIIQVKISMPRQIFHRFLAVVSALVLCATLFPANSRAEHTRSWRQSTYEEFLKGTSNGVTVRSDGRLELSPKFTLLADADASFLWTLRADPKGVLYAGGGSPAKVFRFDANGKPATAFESTDLSVQAIAFDSKGALYVGTNPDGKVYRVSSSGEKSVFFDPKTKYIWDLAFGPEGTLYVATGDKGQIFAVSPDGKSELFYASDEAHIRVMAFDTKGNLLVGTEPSGRVLRITKKSNASARKDKDKEPAAEGFVLYETAKREITALAVSPDGNVYAAAIGEKQHPGATSTAIISTSGGTTTITGGGAISGAGAQVASPFVPFPPVLSGSIYKIAPDGAPEELWTSRDDVVYSLALNAEGRLLAGTGNNGALLAIDGRGVFAHSQKRARRKSPASRAARTAKSFCAPRILARFFRSARNINLKALTNRALSTPAYFRSGAHRLVESAAERAKHKIWIRSQLSASRASNSLCARATPKIPGKSGRAGTVRTRNRAPSKLRLRASRNGKL